MDNTQEIQLLKMQIKCLTATIDLISLRLNMHKDDIAELYKLIKEVNNE